MLLKLPYHSSPHLFANIMPPGATNWTNHPTKPTGGSASTHRSAVISVTSTSSRIGHCHLLPLLTRILPISSAPVFVDCCVNQPAPIVCGRLCRVHCALLPVTVTSFCNGLLSLITINTISPSVSPPRYLIVVSH